MAWFLDYSLLCGWDCSARSFEHGGEAGESMARGRLCARWERPLGLSSPRCSFCLFPAPENLPGVCHHWLFLQRLPASGVKDAHCMSAGNGSVKLHVTDQGQNRPSTFACYKYLMFCEPMSLLLWTRLSITARSVPSSPTGTLLMEDSFLRRMFLSHCSEKQIVSFALFLPPPQKGPVPCSPSKNPLKM